MAYTVKKLSELSGVTVRALHFYEETNLLKPAYYGENGYRYYEEKELLLLQQILFFKELGFTIREIQKVLGKSDFDQLGALYSHRKALVLELEKIEKLIKTIDTTIDHLKGHKKMKEKEIFDGLNIQVFKKAKGTSYSIAEEIVGKSIKNPTKNLQDVEQQKAFYESIKSQAEAIFQALRECIEKGSNPASKEVQELIQKHHALVQKVQDATSEVYQALAKLYLEHPGFKKQLDLFHPRLAGFVAEAMVLFAKEKLS